MADDRSSGIEPCEFVAVSKAFTVTTSSGRKWCQSLTSKADSPLFAMVRMQPVCSGTASLRWTPRANRWNAHRSDAAACLSGTVVPRLELSFAMNVLESSGQVVQTDYRDWASSRLEESFTFAGRPEKWSAAQQ